MADHERVYENHDFSFRIHAQEESFLRAIDKLLDFPEKDFRSPAVKRNPFVATFFLCKSKKKADIPPNAKLSFPNTYINFTRKKIYLWPGPSRNRDQQLSDDTPFLRALSSLLLYYQYYSLHASLVGKGEEIIAFGGKTHSGKSTLAATLASSGHQIFCDDWLFIKKRGKSFELKPLPTKIKVREHARKKDLIPEIPDLIRKKKVFLRWKKMIFIFPTFVQRRSPRITPLSEKEGVGELLSENVIMRNGVPEKKLSQGNHFDILCRLGSKARFYRLWFNDRNLCKIPTLIKSITGK